MKVHFLPSQVDFREQIEQGAVNGRTKWTCPKNAEPGDTVYFIVLGEGVLASGEVASPPTPAPKRWGFTGRYAAEIRRIELLGAPIPLPMFIHRFPKWAYPTYPRTYTTVESPLADELAEFVAQCDLNIVDTTSGDATLAEGTPTAVIAMQYERNKKARGRCLAKWGFSCVACGMTFSEVYGPSFTNYIHVHHLEPLSSKRKSYRLNPEKDLRPICPNCHAVAHRSSPPYSINQIKEFLRRGKSGGRR